MLVNPQVGQRVYRPTLERYGTIVGVHNYTVDIRFDHTIDIHTYSLEALNLASATPEERAQFEEYERRKAHADKYL